MAKNPSFWSRLNVLSWFGKNQETYRRTERKRTRVARRLPFESLEERQLLTVVVDPTTTNVFQDVPAIVIHGSGFDPIVGNNSVVFNDGVGTVTGASDTELTVEFSTPPSEAGILTAVVSTQTENSGTPVQVATVVPTVTLSTNALAASDTSMYIFGTGFDADPAHPEHNVVNFTNGAVGTVTAATATRLTVSIGTRPTVAGPLEVEVLTNGVSSGANVQVATVIPVVTENTTSIDADATSLTINGFGFSGTNTENVVDFDGKAVGVVSSSTATTLTISLTTPPKVAGDLMAIVRTKGVSSAGSVKVATVKPVATVTTTDLPANASTITIDGFGFDTIAANNSVVFNDSAVGVVTLATATRLTVAFSTKPATAGVLNATVTTNGVAGATAQVRKVIPVVTSRTVNVAANAVSMTINGFGFDPTPGNNTVAFNNDATGTVGAASPTSIRVDFAVKPTAAGSLTATVTNNGATSSSVQVGTVTPVVTLSTADMAANLGSVTINGFGFDSTPTNNTVVFNNGAVGTVASGDNTSLVVNLSVKPLTAGPLTAVVTSGGIGSGAAVQIKRITPVVTSSVTNRGADQNTLVINGFGFSPVLANNAVSFDDSAVGTVTAATPTSITVTYSTKPVTAGALNASVLVNSISGGADVQVATITPVVTSNAANVIPVNASFVIITGYGFDTILLNNSVSLVGGATGTVAEATPTSLKVNFGTKPPKAGLLQATVTTNTLASNTNATVASVAPVVLANPGSRIAADATTISIVGIGFDTTYAHNSIVFDSGAVGAVTAATPTLLTVAVSSPPTAGNLNATVTTNGISNGSTVRVGTVRPVVTSSNAGLAATANTITIQGSGFNTIASNNTVVFNNGAEGTVTSATATQLTVTFSPNKKPTSAGSLTAIVTSNGVSSNSAVQVAKVAPVITSRISNLSPDATGVTITGFGFAATALGNTVAFNNDAEGTITAANATSITVLFSKKPKAAGSLTATVTSNGVEAVANNVQVASVIPLILANNNYTLGFDATSMTINGIGFDSVTPTNNIVLFDNGAIGTVSQATGTSLTVDIGTAPTTAGPMNAFVTTNGIGSGAAVRVAKIAPLVSTVTTALGITATEVTITGSGFDTIAANNTVSFSNGALGTVTAATATSLTVRFDTRPTSVGALTAVVSTKGVSSGSPVQVASVIPVITSSTSPLAANTTTFTINGFGFSTTAAENTVSFNNGVVGTVTSSDGTSLSVTVATTFTTVGALNATVTTNGRASVNTQVANVVPAVTLSTESLGANASLIVIRGFGFSPTASDNTVQFNNGAVGTVDSATATSLTISLSSKPTNVGSLTAIVTTSGVASGSAVQVATVKPSVTSNTTGLAATAGSIVINGFGFSTTAADNTVVFNDGAEGTVTSATSTELTVTFAANKKPTTAGNLTAIVTVGSHVSGAAVQVATVTPVATASTVNLAADESQLIINGFGFDVIAANNTVEFNKDAIGVVTDATANRLTVSFTTKPISGGNLTVTVRSNGVASGTIPQVATITPVVVANSSLKLAANAPTVVITGSGFDVDETHNLVTFNNGAVGTVSRATSTSLTVSLSTMPTTAGSLTAIVTTNGAVSGSEVQVAAVAPVVTNSTTPLAANSPTITIAGFGFDPIAANNTVVFSNGAEGTVTDATATQLTVTFANNKQPTVGNLTAVVTSNSVTSGTAVQVATVIPVVTSSTAGLGFNASTIVINGFGFDTTASRNVVTFNNGAAGSVTAASATQLTVTYTTKPTAVGILTASITTNSVSNGSSPQVATIIPVITSSTVNVGVNDATMTINGFGFDSATPGNNVVTLSTGTGTVTGATATTLTLSFDTVPTAGNLTASVVTNSVASDSPVRVGTVKPIITSSTAALEITESGMTIAGFGFDTVLEHNTVSFSNGAVGDVTAATPTLLTVSFTTRPTTVGAFTATVTTNGVASTSNVQVASVIPVITSSTLSLGADVTTLTINGFGFSSVASENTVSFSNGAVGTVSESTTTSLSISFSTRATTVGDMTATVTTNSRPSVSAQVANVIPVVTSSTASLAANSGSMVIRGFGFSSTAADNTIAFSNGVIGNVDSSTSTTLNVSFTTTPTDVGSLTATVTTRGVASSSPVQIATVKPTVTAITTGLLASADTVTIAGFGFSSTAGDNTVVFNDGAEGVVTQATATELTVTFADGKKPSSAGSLTAIVTTNTYSSGTEVQVAAVKPVVTVTTSTLGANESTITIDGFGFDPIAAHNSVSFNKGAVGNITESTTTRLTVHFSTKPTSVGLLTATVTTNSVAGDSDQNVATMIPIVTSSTSNVGVNDPTLTINGFGFDSVHPENNVVTLSSGTGTVTAATATSLTVTFDTAPTAGALTASVATNTFSSGTAVQVGSVKPVVTSNTARVDADENTVTINGFGFDTIPEHNTVVFSSGAEGVVTDATATTLTVTFADGHRPAAGTLSARVTTNSIANSTNVQIATVVPLVTSSTTNLGIDSDSIDIDGTGFDIDPTHNTVVFNNGAVGTVTSATPTRLTVSLDTKPTTVGSLTATVTVNSIASTSNVQVANIVGVITRSTASQGADETTLTIDGFGFSATASDNLVTLSSGAVGTVTVASTTSLTVTLSTRPKAGNLTATVVTRGVSTGTPVQVATINPFVTTSVSNIGSNSDTVTINGFGFDTTASNNSVAFNLGASGNITAATATTLTVRFTTRPTSLGILTAVVTTNTITSGSPVNIATVAPVVTASTTNLALTANTLTINGFGFDAVTPGNNTVVFNNGVTGTVTAATATTLTVTFSGVRTAGNLTAVVTRSGVSSNAVQVASLKPVVTTGSTELPANLPTFTIAGTGFSPIAANNTVVLSNGATGVVTDATSTTLTVSVSDKPMAGSFTAIVTTNGVASGTAVQVAFIKPVITSSTTSLALNGSSLVINGFGFSPTRTDNTVTFSGGAVGTVSASTATSLTITLTTKPTAVGSLTARVTSKARLSDAGVQVAQIVANSLVPTVTLNTSATQAANVSTIVIAGTNFSTTASNNRVTFSNGAIGTVTSATATSLNVTFSTLPKAGVLTAIVSSNGVLSLTAVQIASITPVVTSSTTDRSAADGTLTINGFGFDTTAANNTVTLSNGAAGTVSAATATTLTVTISTRPTSVGNLTAVVTTNSKSSGSPVQVASLLPGVTLSTATLASNASGIIINGFAFDSTASNNTVTFNNGATGTVTASTATTLTVSFDTRPTSLGNLTVTVITNSKSSGTAVQVATVRPVVTASTTNQGGNVSTITINGDGFDSVAENNTVTFSNGAVGTITSATSNALSVSFTTRPAAGSLTALVTTNGVNNGTAVQVANVVPIITSSTAGISPGATSMTINGFGFDTTPARNIVTFSNGITGTVSASTGTTLTVTFVTRPSVVGNLTAQVTTNSVSSGSAIQVATVVPTITSSTNNLTATQDTITIAGSGFSATAANNAVVFSLGAVGRITAATTTSLTVLFTTRPTTLGVLTAVVTTNSVSSGAPVQVGAVRPTVTAATASLALTAGTMTITGTRFDTNASNNTVVFNNGAVGTVSSATATSLTITFSTRPSAGILTAVVTTNGVSTGTPVTVATVAPVVTQSTAIQSVTTTTVTIAGSGFDTTLARNTVTFNNGAVGAVTGATPTSLTVTFSTRPLTSGSLTAIVTVNGAVSGAAVQVASIRPVVTSSTANLSAGAATIVINGFGFDLTGSRNTVVFNNGAVGVVTASTNTSLTVRIDTKPTALGNLTAVVTTNSVAGESGTQVATVVPAVTASTTAITGSTTSILIRGFGFSTTLGNNSVLFNNGAVGNITAATPTVLTVSLTTAPTVAGNLTAVVTTDGYSSGTPVQVASLAPTVTVNTSDLAANSSTVTIAGTGFSTTLLSNRVVFNNGAVGTVTGATSTSLTVTFSVLPTAGALTAIVTTNGVGSGTAIQVGAVKPLVTSSTTNLARTAATIVINGYGFSTTPSRNTIVFNNGATGTVTAATATRLTVTFGTKTTLTGSLTAVITSGGISSGTPVQVANMT